MAGTGRIPFLPIPRGGKIQIPETGMCNLVAVEDRAMFEMLDVALVAMEAAVVAL